MIGNFENIAVKTAFPGKNENQLSLIRSLFITTKTFSSESDFMDRDLWIQAVKDEEIFPITRLLNFNDDTEDDAKVVSAIDYEYEGQVKKYAFTFRAPYSQEYYNNIKDWSSQDVRMFFSDINKNVYAYNVGSTYLGIDIETFIIDKIKLSQDQPAWVVMKVVVYDSEQLNTIKKFTWNPNVLQVISCVISNVTTVSSTEIDFTVKDEVYGFEICELFKEEIVFSDNAGGITVTDLKLIGDGVYRLTASAALSQGTIAIDSDNKYTTAANSGSFVVQDVIVAVSNFVVTSQTVITFDVRRTGNNILYTGLTSGDFTITDTTSGTVTISNVTESPSGTYEITTVQILTSGVIDIDNGLVTGTYNYDIQIPVTLAIAESSFGPIAINATVTETDSGDPVNGLVQSDFTILDGGVEKTPSTFSSNNNVYTFSFNESLSSGTVSVDANIYEGSQSYSFSTVIIRNSGGVGATDWTEIDPSSGHPENWIVRFSTERTTQITTLTGYTGNVWRLTQSGDTTGNFECNQVFGFFKLNTNYQLSFRYRLENRSGMTMEPRLQTSRGFISIGTAPGNTIDTDYTFISDVFQIIEADAPLIQLQLKVSNVAVGISVVYDEVQIIEV